MSPEHGHSVSGGHALGRRTVWPQARNEALFGLVAAIFYNPKASEEWLREELHVSKQTIKRMVKELKETGIIHGRYRAGSTCLNLVHMDEKPLWFPKAIIGASVDIERMKSLGKRRGGVPYRSEEGLLQWICEDLPLQAPFKGTVIVEMADILMGAMDLAIMIRVCGVSHRSLFDFSRHGVEMADGIRGTRTFMIDHTVRKRPLLKMLEDGA